MNMKSNILVLLCILYSGCAFTLIAPLKPLEKNESKHTFYLPVGYQYQRGISDDFEIGFDLGFVNIGGNLRYHLNRSERSLNSVQLGLARTGIYVNYMYTYKTGSATYLRLGPISSYHFGNVFTGSGGSTNRTLRIGGSFIYGGDNWWFALGYSHPVYKNYPEMQGSIFSRGPVPYGLQIFGPEFKIGYSF